MKKITIALFVIFIFVSIGGLSAGLFLINKKVDDLNVDEKATVPVSGKVEVQEENQEEDISQNVPDNCSEKCIKEIEKLVTEATESIPANTVEKIVQVPASDTTQTTYVPLGTNFSTSSMTWVDVPDTATYMDLVNDYSTGATVTWSVSLKVAHGNGKAFARLYDDTNKIAVDYSELSTENNAEYEQVTSSNLPLWRGRNLYKVQVKSLNSFEVTYSGGKIKITY